ncbi:hypothetical protein JB92DRAFT_2825258 [Gautieria morchelliformis]|nr:hypothetical protein JB92DRAFT_2825258 [Gautieria morchelliformis]
MGLESDDTKYLDISSDYHRNKEVQRHKKAARAPNVEERATVLQEDQAQESAVDGNDAGDAEDEQGDVEDQGEQDHKVLDIYLCRADDLTLNFNVQQNPSEDMSQTLSDSDSYAPESDAATWSKGNKPNAKKEGLKPINN